MKSKRSKVVGVRSFCGMEIYTLENIYHHTGSMPASLGSKVPCKKSQTSQGKGFARTKKRLNYRHNN